MIIYCETEDGSHLKLFIAKEDEEGIDSILDLHNSGMIKFIAEDQFYIADPMTIELLDENNGYKIAELTCKRIDFDLLYSLMMQTD